MAAAVVLWCRALARDGNRRVLATRGAADPQSRCHLLFQYACISYALIYDI